MLTKQTIKWLGWRGVYWQSSSHQHDEKNAMGKLTMVAAISALVVSGCDLMPQSDGRTNPLESYPACLNNALQGGHGLAAEDIRSLCEEIAGVANPSYKFTDEKMVPSNEFTRCYRDEKKLLEDLGVEDADRLAKLSCKYPNVD